MRILHLISSGGMYGAEAVILNLSRTLNEQGHASLLGIFANSSNPNLQLHERALAEGIESHLIPCNGQLDRSVPASIRALAVTTNADIVHAHGYKADVYAYLAMRNTPTPLVSTCHNWLDGGLSVRIYGIIDRFILRSYKAVVAVSQEVKHRLVDSGVSPARIFLIRNGIDSRSFKAAAISRGRSAATNTPVRVGWVGRLSPEKGPDLFLRAAAQMHSEFADARFILVGEGPDRGDLERLIADLGLSDSVQLQGRRTDMPAVYASFDFMVSSSRTEGLPMAILEGMASGLPWVATCVGDVPILVRDGLTGVVVPPENVAMLAQGMTGMIQHAEQRNRMGVAAQHLIEAEFSAETMGQEYMRVYSAIIEPEK